MKLCILLLACVFATVNCQEICCRPEVFEVDLGIIGELSRDHFRDDYIENYRIAQDYTKKLRGAEVRLQHLSDGSVELYRLIEDYANNVYWRADSNGCKRYTLHNRTLDRCTPPEAVFVESTFLGDQQVFIDRWINRREDTGRKGFEQLSYTRGYCVPVETSFRGERINEDDKTTEGWSYSGAYVNFKKGIADPASFFHSAFKLSPVEKGKLIKIK